MSIGGEINFYFTAKYSLQWKSCENKLSISLSVFVVVVFFVSKKIMKLN